MASLSDATERNGADAPASHLSGLMATAKTRAHQLKTRFVIGAIGSVILWAAVSNVWAASWFAVMGVSQIIDMRVWRQFRDPARRALPKKDEWIGVCATSIQASVIYSFFPVLLWFMWGVQGKIFAMIWLAGALLHVTMHMHHERRTFFAAATPHFLYFLGLPVYSLITDAAPGRAGSAAILIAGVLYVGHLVIAFKEYQASSTAMRLSREQALQRQASAEQASSAKSTFLANMSHEIRTPMNGILGMAATLEKSDLDPQQLRQVKIIRDSGDLLMSVLNELLDFSKIEANKIEIEYAPFRIRDISGRVESLHMLQAQEKGLDFSVVCKGECDTPLLGDAHRLVQVLHNLINNAIKFTDRGAVSVAIEATPEKLSMTGVTIEVTDTGVGIDKEQASRIFEPFTQADAATTRKYGGTGLGLSIVKGLIDAMGGTVSLHSEIGKGTRMVLELSLRGAPVEEHGETPSTPLNAQQSIDGLRILAAEDNAVNQAVLRAFLAQRSHEIHFASDGLEAVAAFKQNKFDLVLMDISMPVLDGVEAMRQIRFLERETNVEKPVPIIAVSAHAMRQEIKEYLALGFAGYLTKPLRAEDVHAEIDRVMAALEKFESSSSVA